MTDRRQSLTPDALLMMDTIARAGSFAAAARELGKVPSALTYSVRQLEDALDVLLFEGRRLLYEMDAVANRVRRVASGWETQLTISVEDILSMPTIFELVDAFCAVRDATDLPVTDLPASQSGPATRLRIRSDVLAGTWEALTSGQADLAIGVGDEHANPGGIELRPLGSVPFVFCVAPHHPLARAPTPLIDAQLVQHRAVAVADTAQRVTPITVNLLPGQDVLTVPSMRAKLEALLRCLGCGFLPEPLARAHLDAGRLVQKDTARGAFSARLHYAWRAERGTLSLGRALQWWLQQLDSPATRSALLERHAGPLG